MSVAIYSTPQVLTTVVADGAGNFTATVTVPAGLAAGSHTLVASGIGSDGALRYVTLPVTVTAAGSAAITAGSAITAGPRLADTGADVTVPAIAGLAAVALGAGLIVAGRRRSAA